MVMAAYSSYNDAALLGLLRVGDTTAFTEIYNRYWKLLFHLAAAKTNSLAEAEELVQDLFLDMWKSREQLEMATSLKTYLAVALKYRVIICWRLGISGNAMSGTRAASSGSQMTP